MKNVCIFSAMIFLTCAACLAQEHSERKLYGGYNFIRIDTKEIQNAINAKNAVDSSFPFVDFDSYQNLQGWNFGFQEDIKGWVSGVFDISGNYLTKRENSGTSVSTRTKARSYTVMGGPQFTLRRSSYIQPFVRMLVGGGFYSGAANNVVNSIPVNPQAKASDWGFAVGGGCGMDFFFSRRVGFRMAIDYIHTYT
jgi:hypothetical protein